MLRRFLHRLAETDEERLSQELEEWSASISGTVRIADAPLRRPLKVAGAVRRITLRPTGGFEALEAVIYDGSGEVTAVWMGRNFIPGLELGSRVILSGVVGKQRGELRIVNPTFEFA